LLHTAHCTLHTAHCTLRTHTTHNTHHTHAPTKHQHPASSIAPLHRFGSQSIGTWNRRRRPLEKIRRRPTCAAPQYTPVSLPSPTTTRIVHHRLVVTVEGEYKHGFASRKLRSISVCNRHWHAPCSRFKGCEKRGQPCSANSFTLEHSANNANIRPTPWDMGHTTHKDTCAQVGAGFVARALVRSPLIIVTDHAHTLTRHTLTQVNTWKWCVMNNEQ
jgi:hypothetical protein